MRHAILTGETGDTAAGKRQPHEAQRQVAAKIWRCRPGGAAKGYQAAPFKVSERCCYYLKEKPCDDWAKKHNSVPYLGLMASEGGRRQKSLMMHGCNYFGKSTIRSAPFAIFSRQDLLQLAIDLHVPVPAEYGEIVRDADGRLRTTGAQRTGCTMCGLASTWKSDPIGSTACGKQIPKSGSSGCAMCAVTTRGIGMAGAGAGLHRIEWENAPGQLPGQMNMFGGK